MTSLEVLTILGTVNYCQNENFFPFRWREGQLQFYKHQRSVYCAVYMDTNSTEKPIYMCRVKPKIRTVPRHQHPHLAERYGNLHIFIGDDICVAIRKNSRTGEGSFRKLAELLHNIDEGKTVYPIDLIPTKKALLPSTVPITQQPSVKDLKGLDKPATLLKQPANTKNVAPQKSTPSKIAPQKSMLSKKELEEIAVKGFFHDHVSDEDEPSIEDEPRIWPTTTPGNALAKSSGSSASASTELKPVDDFSNTEQTSKSSADVQSFYSKGSSRFSLTTTSAKSSGSSRPTSTKLKPVDDFSNTEQTSKSSTDVQSFYSKTGSSRFPLTTTSTKSSRSSTSTKLKPMDDSSILAQMSKSSIDLQSFYSKKDSSRSPLTTISTNAPTCKRPQKRLYNAVPSSQKKQKTGIEEEKKSQNVYRPLAHVPQKSTWSYLEDDENLEKSTEVGFVNVGNSCYMNSVLQCLLHITCFTEDLRTAYETIEDQLPELSITRCLMSLMSAVQNQKVKRSVLEDVLKTVSKISSCFKEGEQHDAQEFLCQLLSHLDEENEKALGSDKGGCFSVRNNFQFELHSLYECQQCKQKCKRKEEFDMLSVDVPQSEVHVGTLQTCLEKYFSPQTLERVCKACNSKNSRCQQKFSSLPRVLIIHLKRYSFKKRSVKLDRSVKAPEYLTLNQYAEAGITVDIPQRKIHRELNACNLIKSPRKEGREARSPLKTRTNNAAEQRRKRFTLNVHDSPFSMKGGHDGFAPGKDQDQEHDTSIEEMSEEAQLQKAIELSRKDLERREAKQLEEVVNLSLLEDDWEIMVTDDESENLQDFRCEPLESASSSAHTYQLVSIVNHKGRTADSGHYICDIYNHHKSSWRRFNDEIVTMTTLNDVIENSRRSGFVFFYVSRDVLNAP